MTQNGMFKVPAHQVAGHQAIDGQLGPLVDESGRFYKPLQNDDRGKREVWFYESLYANDKVPHRLLKFFPEFYGVQQIEASDGSGLHPHLVLEDIISKCANPCVIDLKIGSRTWYPKATQDYIEKCVKKDTETASLSLGFRISGLKLYNGEDLGYWKPHKKQALGFNVDDIKFMLRKFVSSNDSNVADCAFATRVYGECWGVLDQLRELKQWFEDQTIYQFNSCSILIVYDKGSMMKGLDPLVKIKLIDFAHVYDGEGIIDHNFLGGLSSLIKCISDVLTDPTKPTTAECLINGQ